MQQGKGVGAVCVWGKGMVAGKGENIIVTSERVVGACCQQCAGKGVHAIRLPCLLGYYEKCQVQHSAQEMSQNSPSSLPAASCLASHVRGVFPLGPARAQPHAHPRASPAQACMASTCQWHTHAQMEGEVQNTVGERRKQCRRW